MSYCKKCNNLSLKRAREYLKLSQKYVAKWVPGIAEIESGQRDATEEEIAVLSELYGVTDWAVPDGDAGAIMSLLKLRREMNSCKKRNG